MIEIIIIFSWLIFIPITLLLFCITFECLLALLPTRAMTSHDTVKAKSAILMPAHNESAVIEETLTKLTPQLDENCRLVVIADNCDDDTADMARRFDGVEVIERQHATQRGKGFALDFGMNYLKEHTPPEVVLIVDADCIVHPHSLEHLISAVVQSGRPSQALYLMHALEEGGFKQKITQFAILVKNKIRPLALGKLGAPVSLMGTGMAFRWEQLADASLAHGNIVEDLQLGIDLAIAGNGPQLCPQAFVTSALPSSEGGGENQRTRWEHGHLSTIFTQVPKILFSAIKKPDLKLFLFGLDVAVPPLSLLVISSTASLTLLAMLSFISGAMLPALLLAFAMGLFTLAILLVWQRHGRDIISLKEILCIPLFILSKIPIYLSFLFRRQSDWVKTERDNHKD